jgi:hypothetical protein
MASSQRPSSGPPSTSGQPSGSSPLDKGPGPPREKEPTASQPGGGEPEGRGAPDGPQESSEPPRNEANGPPPKLPTGRSSTTDENQAWGDLPPQVRELFTGAGSSELPAQYRDWIDAYHRRLNRRP